MQSQLIGKDPDDGKDWGQKEKAVAEDEMGVNKFLDFPTWISFQFFFILNIWLKTRISSEQAE